MLVTLSSFTLTGFGADAVLSVSASVIASGKPEQTSVVLPAGPDTFTCVPDLTVTVPFRPSNGRPSTTDSVIRFSLYSTGDFGRVIIANAEIAAGAVASPGSSAVPVPWTASTLGLSGEITLSVNMDDGDAISDTEKVDAVSPVGGGKASSTDSEDASDDGTPAPAEPSQSFIPAPVVSAPTTAVSSRVASVAPSDAEPSSAEDEDEEGVQAVNGTIIVIAKQLDNLLDSHLTVRLVDGAGRVVDSGTALVASPGPLSPIPLRYANVTDAEGYAVVVEVGRNGSTAASGRVDASELMGAVSNADDEEADNSEDVSIALNSPSGELLTSITLSMSSACEAIRITPATPSPAPRTVPKRTPVLTPLSSAGGRKLGRPFLRTDSAGAVLSQLNTKSLALDRGISPADTADLQSEVGEGTSIASDSNWDGLSAVSGRSRFSLFKNKSAIPVGNQPKRHLGKRVMMLSGRLSVTLQSVSIAALVGDPVLSDDAQVTVAFELVEVVGDHLLSTGHAHPAPHTAGVCSWSEDPATVSLPYNAVRADVECAVLCKIWLTRDDMDEAVLLGSGTADANGWMGTSNPGRTCVIPLVVEDKGRIGEVSLTMASDCTSTAMSTIGPNTPVGWKQSRRHRGTMVPLAVGLTDERDPLTPQTAPAAVRRATAPVLRPRVSAITPAVEATPVAVLAQDTLCVCIPNTSSLCPVLSSSAAVTLVLTLSEGSRMVSSCSQVVTLGASNAADKEWKLPLTSLDPTASSHDTRFQTVQAAGYRLRLQVLDGSSGVQDGFVAMGEADVSLPISKVCPQIVPPRMKRAQGTVVSASIPIHNRNDFSLGCDLELKFRCDRPAQDPFSGASGVPSVPIPPASTPCWVVVSLNVLEVCYVSKAEVLLKRPALRQPGVGRGVTLKAVLVNECGHLLSVSHSGCAQLSWTAHTLQPFLFTDGTGSMQLCYRHRPSTGDDSRSSDVTSGWRVCVEVFGGKGLGDAIGFLEFTVSECHKEGRARPIIRSLVSDDYVGTVSVAVALDIEPLQPGSDPYLPDYPISPRPPLVISPGKREGTSAVRSKFTSVCLAVHISTASDILNTTPLPSVALVADVLTTPTDLLPLINGQFELSQTPEGTWIAPDDGMIVLPFAIPERADVENYTLRLSLLRPTSYRFAQCDVPLKPFLQQSSASSDIELLLTGNTGDAEMPFAGTLRCSVTSDVRTGVPSGVPISGPSPVQELQATVVELGKRVADAGVKLESLGEAKVSLQKLCLLQSVLVRQLVTVCESAGGHIPPLFTAVADKLDEMKANIAAELADLDVASSPPPAPSASLTTERTFDVTMLGNHMSSVWIQSLLRAVSPGPTPDSIGDVDHTIIGALLQAAQGDIDPLLRLLTHVNSLNWTLKARLQETERLLVLTEKTLKERIGRLKHKLVAARSYSNTAPSESPGWNVSVKSPTSPDPPVSGIHVMASSGLTPSQAAFSASLRGGQSPPQARSPPAKPERKQPLPDEARGTPAAGIGTPAHLKFVSTPVSQLLSKRALARLRPNSSETTRK